ncbi:hypothetical protein PHYPSEUDO_004550 [Phytophthora pseudosyringae]|uniref:Uncharacterized protein n=1 Tax=Phytophthora pseudosyringae TaxID=221518 RepID=A0A8T1WIQ4_9STRA|nr:hypothetical protein PHYPSEUDO_004550 [Phytophthora pseudosyringae]
MGDDKANRRGRSSPHKRKQHRERGTELKAALRRPDRDAQVSPPLLHGTRRRRAARMHVAVPGCCRAVFAMRQLGAVGVCFGLRLREREGVDPSIHPEARCAAFHSGTSKIRVLTPTLLLAADSALDDTSGVSYGSSPT